MNISNRESRTVSEQIPLGEDGRIVLPFKYINEVKSSDETNGMGFLRFCEQIMLLQYSKSPCQTPACTYALKQFLNRNLMNMTPVIHAGIVADIASALPQTNELTPVVLYRKMIFIVARNTAGVLADPQLCDNEEWIQITVSITIRTFQVDELVFGKEDQPPEMFVTGSTRLVDPRASFLVRVAASKPKIDEP